MSIPSKIQKMKPFLVMDILEEAKKLEAQGENIIHLEIGEPDFDTPNCIKQAACRAMEKGETHYTHSLGLIELREAICQDYFNKYNVGLHPDQIVITSGTSPGMLLCFAVLLDHEDPVVFSDPGYACYSNFISFVGGQPYPVKVHEEDGFQLRPEEIKKVSPPHTKGILINSPANPTGNILSPSRMEKLADLGHYIISDEIYHGLVYKGKAHSILEFTNQAFVLNGFSKLYAMTGWRLGYLIVPQRFIREVQKLAQNLFICAGSIVQWAAITAINEAQKEVEAMVQIYDQRRKCMLKRLKELGFKILVEPTGAFYVLANAKHIHPNSYELAFDILKEAKVGVTPGIDFGQNGEGFLRFSYANSIDNINQGFDRLEAYLKKRKSIKNKSYQVGS